MPPAHLTRHCRAAYSRRQSARHRPSEKPMRRLHGYRQLTVALALIAAPTLQALGQATAQASAPAQPAAEGRKDPGKVLTLADYGRWNRVTQTAISPDGKWMTYAYQPNDGD